MPTFKKYKKSSPNFVYPSGTETSFTKEEYNEKIEKENQEIRENNLEDLGTSFYFNKRSQQDIYNSCSTNYNKINNDAIDNNNNKTITSPSQSSSASASSSSPSASASASSSLPSSTLSTSSSSSTSSLPSLLFSSGLSLIKNENFLKSEEIIDDDFKYSDSESESEFEPEPEPEPVPEPVPEPKVNSEQDILKNYLDIKNLKICYCCKRYSLSSSFYKGNVEMCVPCIKVIVEKEQESNRIGKKRKTNYHDPNSYCMVCCAIRTHYFSHIDNKHNGVDINQVIMDHYLKYPRSSYLGKENIENEDYLIVPFTQSFNENDIFIDTDEKTFLQCYECLQFQPLSNYKKNTYKMCLFKKGTLYTETVAARALTKSKKHFKQGRKGTYSLTKTALEKICDEYQNRCAITMVEFVKRSDKPNSLSANRIDNSITYDIKYKENGKEFCNVEPIIRIMQSSTNWNRAKWLSVKTRREQDFTMDVIYSESFVENVLFSLNLLLNTSHKSTIERNNKKKLLSLIGFGVFLALFLFSVGSYSEESCDTCIIGRYTCMGMSSSCGIPLYSFLSLNNLNYLTECNYGQIVVGKNIVVIKQ
ncbi:hypothetical protein ACTFIW_009550 [Dictyostelium discoideum]